MAHAESCGTGRLAVSAGAAGPICCRFAIGLDDIVFLRIRWAQSAQHGITLDEREDTCNDEHGGTNSACRRPVGRIGFDGGEYTGELRLTQLETAAVGQPRTEQTTGFDGVVEPVRQTVLAAQVAGAVTSLRG